MTVADLCDWKCECRDSYDCECTVPTRAAVCPWAPTLAPVVLTLLGRRPRTAGPAMMAELVPVVGVALACGRGWIREC